MAYGSMTNAMPGARPRGNVAQGKNRTPGYLMLRDLIKRLIESVQTDRF
jgi:hypothetical protein